MDGIASGVVGGPARRHWTLVALTALAVAVGASWLLVVFLVNGTSVLNAVRLKLQTAQTVQLQSVAGVLTRSASLSAHVDVAAVYATPEFFSVGRRSGRSIPYAPETSLIFIINEDTHQDDLSYDPTPARLRVDGGRLYEPDNAETLTYSIHHKVTVLSFRKDDPERGPIVSDRTRSLELLVPIQHGPVPHVHTGDGHYVALRWDLPIAYPEPALRARPMPLGTMLAFAGGLLATVLTPCLIQLVLYYLSALTGLSSERIATGALTTGDRRRVLTAALGFVSGFTVLFTGAGALAGFAGQTLQNSDLWAAWTRPLAVGAGVVMVLLGLWMAARARAPLVCRLPLARIAQARDGGLLRSILMGFSFAIGCATCFGGALIGTLLLYVGTLGSATDGALILFLFSLGVDIPFLMAALLLTRVLTVVSRLERTARVLGMASSVVMMGFGVLLITDDFHRVSGWIYRWFLS